MNRVQSRAAFRRLAGEGDGCIGLYLQGEEISFGSDHHLLRLYIPAPEQVLGQVWDPTSILHTDYFDLNYKFLHS